MHRFNQCMAVVFVQARPYFGCHLKAGAFSNGFPGLAMAFKTTDQHRIKLKFIGARSCLTGLSPIFTQTIALAFAQVAQLVVVFCAERSLAMTHEYQLSHAQSLK